MSQNSSIHVEDSIYITIHQRFRQFAEAIKVKGDYPLFETKGTQQSAVERN